MAYHRRRRFHRITPRRRAPPARRAGPHRRRFLRRPSRERAGRQWSSSKAISPIRTSHGAPSPAADRHSSGRDSVGAAIGQGSGRIASRQRRRDARAARRRARRRRQAPRLRRLLVGLRQRRRAAEARGHAAEPLSPYALQKLVGEQYCQMFTSLYGLETVTTRYFNVFGPRQQPGSPYSGVISLFIEALAEGRPPQILGDGQQTRDFTYVGDVVTGVLAAREAPDVAGEVINVAAGGRISLLELIRTLQRILKTRDRADVRPGARRRRPRLAGRHHEGAQAARLQRVSVARRGAAPDGGVVPDVVTKNTPGEFTFFVKLTRRVFRRRPSHMPAPAGRGARGRIASETGSTRQRTGPGWQLLRPPRWR